MNNVSREEIEKLINDLEARRDKVKELKSISIVPAIEQISVISIDHFNYFINSLKKLLK